MMNRHPSLLIVAVFAIGLATLPSSTQGQEVTDKPIIVLGEVQGAANTVAAFLEQLELIDSENNWTGGDTILIQMGDLIDDGEHVRAALDLFISLQEQAAAAGGQVIVLMGNHEALNILGELREVNPMAYQSFAGPNSEQRRRQAWEEWSVWRKVRAEAVGETFEANAEAEQAWYASHPPGWVEYVESMRPEGVYGAWLRSLPVAVEVNDVLFVHGGLNQEIEDKNVASMNHRAAEEIKSFDDYREQMVGKGLCLPTSAAGEMVNVINQEAAYINGLDDSERTTSNPRVATLLEVYDLGQWKSWSVINGKGPLCFRGAARWPEEDHAQEMAAILDAFHINRIVTGQSDGRNRMIQARFDNRVLLTSVDLSDDPDGRGGEPQALEIVGGDYFVVTMHGRELLIDN
jgi:hypothetical protein